MSITKKFLGLSMAVVALFAFNAASAFASDTGTCAFTGLAGNLTPPIPAAANDPGGATTIETGTYQFAGTATCVKADGDSGQATNSGVYSVSITSNGDYANRVCGTGQAFGRSLANTSLSSAAAGWEGPVHATYDITFTGGAGALLVHQTSNAERTNSGNNNGGGYVQIIPADGNCATTNVGAFTVAGSFTAVI
jgi:hypothetical protein